MTQRVRAAAVEVVTAETTSSQVRWRSPAKTPVAERVSPSVGDFELTLTFDFYRPPPDAPPAEQARSMNAVKEAIVRCLERLK